MQSRSSMFHQHNSSLPASATNSWNPEHPANDSNNLLPPFPSQPPQYQHTIHAVIHPFDNEHQQQQHHLGSMAKIIDIGQKTRRLNKQSSLFGDAAELLPQHQLRQQAQEELQECRTANRTSGQTIANSASSSSSQRQVNEVGVAYPSSQVCGAQKQQSGETLSSFESDYDLLVYLGETETEDIVDTERSLDYQDQTWRQSICGGASLAPTIDESLSELVGQQSLIIGGQDHHHQQQQHHLLDPLSTPTLLSASHSPFASPSRSPLGAPPQVRYRQPAPLDSSADEYDHDGVPLDDNTATSGAQRRNDKTLTATAKSQEPEASRAGGASPSSSSLGSKLVSLVMNRKATRGEELPLDANNNNNNKVNQGSSSWQRNRSRAMNPREQYSTSSPPDELDKLLAEMSQSLDLDSLARFDPQPQPQPQPPRRPQARGQTLQAGYRDQVMPQMLDERPAWRNANTLASSSRHEANKSNAMGSWRPDRIQKHQIAASSESSILDEYDGASRMLEQMISDQLRESAANRGKLRRQRTDSQSVNSVNSRDSPKSVISTTNPLSAATQVQVQRNQGANLPQAAQQQATNAQARPPLPQQRPVPLQKAAGDSQSTASDQQVPAAATAAATGSRKVSSCSSSVASTVLMPAGRHESGSPPARRARRSSGAGILKSLALQQQQQMQQPPVPPKVDYVQVKDADRGAVAEDRVTHLEPDELPSATSSDDEETAGRAGTLVATSAKPPPVELMDRMKRRTLSSMRSMRNRISDMMPGGGGGGGGSADQQRQRSQSKQGAASKPNVAPPRPPKRSSSIGSRHSDIPRAHSVGARSSVKNDEDDNNDGSQSRAGSPEAARQPRPQVRESRSAKRGRAPVESPSDGGKQTFGQQLRERISRSKSRFSRLLRLPHTKRAQSQPSKRTSISAPVEPEEILFGPSDIARNSGLPAKKPDKAATAANSTPSTPSSFGHSLERHLAADLAKRRDSSSSSSSSLSGLDTSGSRSRIRRRQSKSPREQAPRPLSVISLARAKQRLHEAEAAGETARKSASVSAGCSPAPSRRRTSSMRQKPTATTGAARAYFGPAYSLADASSEGARRSSSQDELPVALANASIWRPSKRSQSMKSVRLSTPGPPPATIALDCAHDAKATDAILPNRPRQLPVAANTFRPASACAQLAERDALAARADKLDVGRSLAATPIGLGIGAPIGGETQLLAEAQPAIVSTATSAERPGDSARGSSARLSTRAKSATTLLDDIKQKCSGLFGSAQAHAPPAAPVAPPRRRHRRSKSLVAAPEMEISAESRAPVVVATNASNSAGKRLTLFAQQLKHSAADFFQQPSGAKTRAPAAVASSASNNDSSNKTVNLREWKPVIASGGRQQRTWSKARTMADRTGESPAKLRDLQQQRSLDTDSTWDTSASNTEDDQQVGADGAGIPTSNASAAKQDRSYADESCADSAGGSRRPQATRLVYGGDMQVAALKQLKQQQARQVELNNNNNHNNNNNNESVKCEQQVEKTPATSERIELELDPEQQQQQQEQQLAAPPLQQVAASRVAHREKRQHSKQTPAADRNELDGGELRDTHAKALLDSTSIRQSADAKDSGRDTDRDRDRARASKHERRLCEIPFKFNADLPLPSEIVVAANLARRDNAAISNNDKKDAQVDHCIASTSNQDVVENKRQEPRNLQDQQHDTKTAAAATSGEKMTADVAARAVAGEQKSKTLDEADARCLKAIGGVRRPAVGPSPNRPVAAAADPPVTLGEKLAEDEEGGGKRLSVYENEPLSGGERRQKSPACPPPPVPVRPASVNKTSGRESRSRVSESPSGSQVWSVDEDNCVSAPVPVAASKPPPAQQVEATPPPPAKPKRKLITMTSIIQDPNDELMNAAASPGAPSDRRASIETPSARNSAKSNGRQNTSSNSTDSDSSMAGPTTNTRKLLQDRLAPQPAAPSSVRPKCPAFSDGGRASGGSLVKRLAKNFDQVAAAAAASGADSPGAGRGKSALSQARGGADEEPKSESSQWFDASCGELGTDAEDQLDEAELAELLAEFEASERPDPASGRQLAGEQQQARRQLSTSVSEDVSTGAEPFVTVAESTLELVATATTGDGEPHEDDTLNDDDDDDEDDVDQLADELADESCQPMTAADEEQEVEESQTTTAAVAGEHHHDITSPSHPPETSPASPVSTASSSTSSCVTGQTECVARVVDKPAMSKSSDDESSGERCYQSNESAANKSCHLDADTVPPPEPLLLPQKQQVAATAAAPVTMTNATATHNDNNLAPESCCSPMSDTCGTKHSEQNSPQPAATTTSPPPAATPESQATEPSSTCAQQEILKPIDDSFKNSLNNIIGRRPSQQQQQQVAGTTASAPDSSGRSSASPAEHEASLKKPPGASSSFVARYYKALLRRGRRPRASKKQVVAERTHSSASSSAASSSASESSSAASSRSSSPTAAAAASRNEDTGEQEAVPRTLRTGNTKSSELLYEELERMLARRLSSAPADHELEGGTQDDNDDDGEQQQQQRGEDETRSSQAPDRVSSEDQVSLSSSSIGVESIPELRQRQNLQKLYHIVNEIYSSESKFVDTLRLLNCDFRRHMDQHLSAPTSSAALGGPKGAECVHQMLRHLPQLQLLNESLLAELGQARDQWPHTRKISHVLVKIGPFLKHYSTYIKEFDATQQQLLECQRTLPQFAERIKEFEASERCQKLTLQHHLLRPIQRIPQYRLLLQQYLHHLKPDDIDYEHTVEALEVVSRVAEHANQSMNEGANFAKLLGLQTKIVGKQRDIVQPGRLFVKEGELMKVCRKQVQPRRFVLLNDALLYLTQIQSSDILYLNNELPLDDCFVSTPNADELVGEQFETEFSVQTRARSFTLIAKSRRERDEWVDALKRTISQHVERRLSFQKLNQQQQQQTQLLLLHRSPSSGSLPNPKLAAPAGGESHIARPSSAYYLPPAIPGGGGNAPGDAPLGHKAPLWTPDSRVTMCQLCTSSFSTLFRRHHCRACGRVVCSACSANKAPLVYLKCRTARACDQCFEQLKANLHLYYQLAGGHAATDSAELRRLDDHFRALIKGQFRRHNFARRSSNANAWRQGQSSATAAAAAPARSNEGKCSGVLHRRHATKAKWKRQWFVIREHVLYAYRAIDDVAAVSSMPLLGYQADQPSASIDGYDSALLIRLRHHHQYPLAAATSGQDENQTATKTDEEALPPPLIEHLFKAESTTAAQRWLDAFRKSVVLQEADDDATLDCNK